MKPIGEKELEKILCLFKQVHHEKGKSHVSDNWQTNVMSLVRKDSGRCYQTGFVDIFQQFVWRLAPVSCVLAILLAFFLSQTDVLSDYELVKIFIADPSDLSFISLYNV